MKSAADALHIVRYQFWILIKIINRNQLTIKDDLEIIRVQFLSIMPDNKVGK